jgi:hypothetical protein
VSIGNADLRPNDIATATTLAPPDSIDAWNASPARSDWLVAPVALSTAKSRERSIDVR